MALTPDQIRNMPAGETVGSILLKKNLRRIKRPNEKNKVGFQGKTSRPIEAGVKPISAGYKRQPVEAGVPTFTATPQYRNYIEKPPWERIKIYDVNDQFSTLKEMYRYYNLGGVVHPGLALGVLFSPALNRESIPFLFQGENFRNKLKELSAKYQPETLGTFVEQVGEEAKYLSKELSGVSLLSKGWKVFQGAWSGAPTTKRIIGAYEYSDWKALSALPEDIKREINLPDKPWGTLAEANKWEGIASKRITELSVDNTTRQKMLTALGMPADTLIGGMARLNMGAIRQSPVYEQAKKQVEGMSVKDVAAEFWQGAAAAYKGKEIEATEKPDTIRGISQRQGKEFKYHPNPVLDVLGEVVVDPLNLLIVPSIFAKGKLLKAVEAGKLPSLTKWSPQLKNADTLGDFALRIGFREGWDNAAQAVKSVIDTPVFRKLADEAGFLRFGKKPKIGEEILTGKITKEVTDDIVQDVGKLSPLDKGTIPQRRQAANYIKDKWVKTRETIEDDWIRVRKLVEQKGVKIADESDPYLKRKLTVGAEDFQLREELSKTATNIDKNIVVTSKKIGIKNTRLTDEVNKYLQFRHAPERNKAIREAAAGVTTKKAEEGLRALRGLSHSTEIKRIADDFQKLSNKTLDILLDGQVIEKKLYNTLKTRYKNHIPLNRIFEDTEDVGEILIGRGLDVRGTGLRRAKGSKREVADIATNIVHNHKQAIIRANKNKIDLATLKFVRENDHFKGLFKEIKPRAIGKTFSGQPILQRVVDPHVLTLREAGKPVYLKINDTNLALALRGVNRKKLDAFSKISGGIVRYFSRMATTYNPAFFLPNKIRDMQETLVYLASRKELGFKGAAKALTKDAASVKDVFQYLRGEKTAGANLYEELKRLGGTTGGHALSTRKAAETEMAAIRKLNRSKPRQAAKKIVEAVENFNTIFEDSTRLTVFKQALKEGMSKPRAAALAKEASVDFNKMGTGSPLLNSWYMFANASVQGAAKSLRAMRNPKVLAGTVLAITGANFAVQEYNDKTDPDWRNKISKWDKLNGLNIVLPWSSKDNFNYVTIPIGWSLKPIHVMSGYAADLLNDKKTSLKEAMSNVMASAIDAYNPAGGTDPISAITPTIGDIPIDVIRNRRWSGSMIRPDWDKYAPSSEQYFEDLRETEAGKRAITLTSKLSEASGGRIEISPADSIYVIEQLIGGAGKTGLQATNTIIDLLRGTKPRVRNIPVISRFLRSRSGEEIGAGSREAEEIKEILTSQSRSRIKLKRNAEAIYSQLKKMPQSQGDTVYNRLIKEKPKTAKLVYETYQEEALGLTGTDRLVKSLGVKNGERANYIARKINQFKSDKDKEKYYNDLVKKKIITTEVYEQITKLLAK